MITFHLVSILGVLLMIVLMNLFKKAPKPVPAPIRPADDLANLKVTDARTGDVLSVAGAGANMTDLGYTGARPHPTAAGGRSGDPEGHRCPHRRCPLRGGRGRQHDRSGLHGGPRHAIRSGVADLGGTGRSVPEPPCERAHRRR